MRFLLKIVISGIAVLLTAWLLKGVHVDNYGYALLVALVIALLNVTVKPIAIFLTLPATVITFGLFLLVINALMILLADKIVPGFTVDGFWWALLFSIILSLINSLLYKLLETNKSQ